MGRPRSSAALKILMNGLLVGRLARASTGQLRFDYDKEWLERPEARPLSISMPLSRHGYVGDRAENFFDNLLPDSLPIRKRIQARVSARSGDPFDLLWHIGRDCVGAVQLLPEDAPEADIRTVDAVELSEAEIAETLRNYAAMPLGMTGDDDFRISIAGAQEKTALLRLNNGWCRPFGVTPTSHIFKLPLGKVRDLDLTDSVENEWLCHMILKAYGIPVAEAEMASFAGVKALVVERFDRRWSGDGSWLIRLPQEDMCQALNVPSALKYESDGGPGVQRIMDLLLGGSHPMEDRALFLKSQVLFWLMGATDGHAKNFSIFIEPGGGYRLTPLYDVISAFPLVAKGQLHPKKMKMAMGVKGKNNHYVWDSIQQRHWVSMAQSCRFPAADMEAIIVSVCTEMESVIESASTALPASFPNDIAEPIFEWMRKGRTNVLRGSC